MELPLIAGLIGIGYYYNNKKKIYNKVDKSLLPVIYNDNKKNMYDNSNIIKLSVEGEKKNNEKEDYGLSLTGEPIQINKFKHNNMVPFFGGKIKQNTDEKAHLETLENYTGQIENYQEKREQGLFFDTSPNFHNPYGSASTTQYEQDRIVPSKIMNNVSPIDKVYVGPGINRGYTSEPSGGYQQADARDYVLPLTVDEMRVKTNPKLTYYGRVLNGLKTGMAGTIGKVEKRNPDTFYINTPDRYFTTTGAHLANANRPNIIIKDGNRKTTVLKTRIGSAVSTNGNLNNIRPENKKSKKVQFKTDGPRNLDLSGKWDTNNGDYILPDVKENPLATESEIQNLYKKSLKNIKSLHDYGKSRIDIKNTERQFTPQNIYRGPLQNKKNSSARNKQNAKETKKTSIENNDYVRHVSTVNKASIVYDPKNIPRTTIKEQLVDNDHNGFINVNVKDSYAHNPNNIAKKTIKETTIENGRYGIAKGLLKAEMRSGEKPKTTVKETTLLEDVIGGLYKTFGLGYTVTNNNIKNTQRQSMSTEYSGIANYHQSKPQSYESIQNSTSRSMKDQISVGRMPTLSGPKKLNHDISMTSKKLNDIQNRYYIERGIMPTKVYNSLPQYNKCNETRDKMTLPNEQIQNRLDSYVLDQLKENPYSLHK